jgi:isopenicillin-N N-acyltransferase-like protein
MTALAEACGISPEEAVIAGGFTDFVDAVRSQADAVHEEDDCTAVIVPDAMAGGQGFLAQTWDMHDSATEYVVLLEIEPDAGPSALVFSTVGCVGQIGLNDAGIAIGINNLAAAVGKAAVTWPFVVRKALAQTSLDAALACVVDADLSGAHNYLLFDAHGRGYNVEAMPHGNVVRELGGAPLYHTNHCVEPDAKQFEAVRPPPLLESSHRRLARARQLIGAAPVTLDALMDLTRDAEAVCQRSKPPYHIESSGAAIMRPATGELWAVWGLPSENDYERFVFGGV